MAGDASPCLSSRPSPPPYPDACAPAPGCRPFRSACGLTCGSSICRMALTLAWSEPRARHSWSRMDRTTHPCCWISRRFTCAGPASSESGLPPTVSRSRSVALCSRMATDSPPVVSGGSTKSSTCSARSTCTPCLSPRCSSAPDTSRSVGPGCRAEPNAASAATALSSAAAVAATMANSAGMGGSPAGASSCNIRVDSATKGNCARVKEIPATAVRQAGSSGCSCSRKARRDHKREERVAASASHVEVSWSAVKEARMVWAS
mmetsp:Transcript_9121/g.30231  ORF Transcript_9121/g.30231 Transcript_9121/m.30231 type:complete len:262 (+) Transcript_9121:442-1227(+)